MELNININVHLPASQAEQAQWTRIESKLGQVLTTLANILNLEQKQMADLDAVLQDVQAESTQIDGLSTLTAGLKQQLADALAGTTLPPAVQAKVDAVFAGVEANKQKVIDAINANTAAAPAGGGDGTGTGSGGTGTGGDGSGTTTGS